ncbi:hypothetical protein [Nocardia sp. NPDC020380]|uniref:hypothetical protein n=1 Tax=Nocardia sp. NPDC020380 TaxID=3364309 RepID=UPI0037A43FA9
MVELFFQARDVVMAGGEPCLQPLRIDSVAWSAGVLASCGERCDLIWDRTILGCHILDDRGGKGVESLEVFPHGGLRDRALGAVATNVSAGIAAHIGERETFDRAARTRCGDAVRHHLLSSGDDHCFGVFFDCAAGSCLVTRCVAVHCCRRHDLQFIAVHIVVYSSIPARVCA